MLLSKQLIFNNYTSSLQISDEPNILYITTNKKGGRNMKK